MNKLDINKEIDNNNKIILKIFNLVKMQDWKNLSELIKSNKIDYNIQDSSNIYLLEYAILFNQKEIIELLIDNNVRLDITDDNNRSILYNIIKFSYIDILKLILEKNKNVFGKNILDIKDSDDNIPLFYAIKFYNIEALKIMVKYTNNFYIKNSDGDNPLHQSIISKNLEIFKIIYEKNNLLKLRNFSGETSFHLIIKNKCYDIIQYLFENVNSINNFEEILNLTEYRYNFSLLHYICIYTDYQFLNIFNEYKQIEKLDGNIQDNSGNIFYHYFINNIIELNSFTDEIVREINNFNELAKKIKFNFNLYNIDGNTPCHILVKNLEIFTKNELNGLITYLIDSSDINIQNFNGESVFFILVKNNYWKNVKNILIYKKLDIFVFTNDSKTFFDYIENKDLKEFIDMVTQSYLYQIKNVKKASKWLDYWDNRCTKNIKLEELNETELDLIKSFSSDNNHKSEKSEKSDNICYEIIYNKIKNYINHFLKNKNRYEVNSFPITRKYIKFILNYPNVNISTFTGSTLDVLCGLIYLLEKFNIKAESTILDTSLELLDLNKNIINCNVIDVKTNNKICEISGFEIIWKNQSIYIPSSSSNDLIRLLTSIKLNKKIRFLIIPLGIEQIINNITLSHANYLIFDFELMQVERFEPHGAYPPVGLDYNPKLLDTTLENKINSVTKLNFQYIPPNKYLPKIGFQIKEINELKSDYIGDPNGFCALWCIWWADLRISNPNIPRDKLVKILMKEMINENYSFKKLIRDYSFYILEIRDNILNKVNTNINEWMNDTISQNNIDLLNNILIDTIKKYLL